MGTILFEKEMKHAVFCPMCKDGHLIRTLDADFPVETNFVTMDNKGWLRNKADLSEDIFEGPEFLFDGTVRLSGICERCAEKGGPGALDEYFWDVTFASGLFQNVVSYSEGTENVSKECTYSVKRPKSDEEELSGARDTA